MTDIEHRAPDVVPSVDDLLEMAQNVSAGLVSRRRYLEACQLRADRAVEDAVQRFTVHPAHWLRLPKSPRD